MIRQCCYCGETYGNTLKAPPGVPPGAVSHGICPKCRPVAEADADRAIAAEALRRQAARAAANGENGEGENAKGGKR